MQTIQKLIAEKNRAFDALYQADLCIARRTHSHLLGRAGTVPEAWYERREELAQAYHSARASVGWGRRWRLSGWLVYCSLPGACGLRARIPIYERAMNRMPS